MAVAVAEVEAEAEAVKCRNNNRFMRGMWKKRCLGLFVKDAENFILDILINCLICVKLFLLVKGVFINLNGD